MLQKFLFHIGLLCCLVTGIAHAQQEPVGFEADRVTVNQDDNSLIADGNVILRQPGTTLSADKIIYNQQTDIAIAVGNVVLTDADGTVTRADTMTLSSQFTTVIAEPLISDLADGGRFTSVKGERIQGENSVFFSTSYTPCNCDYDKGQRPIWDLRSTKAVHDLQTQTIRHENVRLTIFGLPVFYVPFLAHPDWTVNRRSGFLAPRFKFSRDLGTSVTTPYFQVISPTQDIEFQPTKFQYRGIGLKSIYRQMWDNAELNANIYTADVETYKKDRENVAAIDAHYGARIGSGWHVKARLYRSSQDTFLRRYGYDSESELKSYLSAQKVTQNQYYHAEISDIQSLKSNDQVINEPTILPSVFYEQTMPGYNPNQEIRTQVSALQLDNDEGHEIVRWTSNVNVTEQQLLKYGIGEYDVGFSASYYDVQARPDEGEWIGEIGRATAHMSVGWRNPIQLSNGIRRLILQPQIKFTHISGADRTDEIPNRDAADFRLDQANIFLTHRYQGQDYVLPGSRADMGVSLLTDDEEFGKIAAFVGVSQRTSGRLASGLNAQSNSSTSDYVASMSIDPPGPLALSWSGRADSDDYELNESSTTIDAKFGGSNISLSHRQLSKAHFTSAQDDLEEAALNFTQTLGGGWSANVSQVWDLSQGQSKQESSTFSLLWSGGFQDCLTLSIDYKRIPNDDRDIKTINEVQLVLNFKHLGSISQSDITTATE